MLKKLLKIGLVLVLSTLLFSCDPPTSGGGQDTETEQGQDTETEASEFERSIATEVNLFRSNPKSYVATYITGKNDWFTNEQQALFNTHEGYSSLVEDVENKTTDLGQLAWLDGIYKCAKKHCNEQLEANTMNHDRSTTPTKLSDLKIENNKIVDKGAMGVFCNIDAMSATAGENLSGSMDTARNIVIQLLLDDNVKGRGHRENLMNTDFKQIGTAFGRRDGYTAGGTLNPTLCVMDFGAGYVNKD